MVTSRLLSHFLTVVFGVYMFHFGRQVYWYINVALCGIDLSKSKIIYGYRETALIFSPKRAKLPDNLTYDSGDINKIGHLLPSFFKENKNA